MVDRLSWKVRVAKFELLPSKGLPLAESGHRTNRFVCHRGHVIGARVFQDVLEFAPGVNRDVLPRCQGLHEIGMVIMKVSDEYPFQISKHAPSLQTIDLADHVLAAAVDQERRLGIGHDQTRRAKLVPPTRRGLPQIGCHRHPFDLGVPKHSPRPLPEILLSPVPSERIRSKIGPKQPAKPGLKSLDVAIRIEDDGSTSGHDNVQVLLTQGLEARDHIGCTGGVPVIAASLGFLDGVLQAVQVKDSAAFV